MTQTKLMLSQDLLVDGSGDYGAGFNSRLFGKTDDETNGYPAYPSPARQGGWCHADKMIREGKVFYTHRFKHPECRDGYAFPYGGTWVCNSCGRSGLNKPWWIVKVFQDGNAWCCVGRGFENLQESSNYAFGETRDEALANYEKLMQSDQGTKGPKTA